MIYSHALGTDFSTVMHSRGSCVSPLLVWWKWGATPPEIKLLTWTEIRHSVF